MTLRRTFFTLLGAFAVLSAIAGLWQLADSRDKAAAAEWIDLKNGEALAERLRAPLADTPAPTATGNIDVRISIGVAPLTGEDTSQILSRADKALYAAKAAGRNRVSVWSTGHENKLALPVV